MGRGLVTNNVWIQINDAVAPLKECAENPSDLRMNIFNSPLRDVTTNFYITILSDFNGHYQKKYDVQSGI